MRSVAKYAPLLLVFGSLTLRADDSTAPKDSKSEKPKAAKNLSVDEMRTESAAMKAEGENALQSTLRLREGVVGQKDRIKVNCINDRLFQMKAQLNIADATYANLQEDLGTNRDSRFARFESLASLFEKIRKLKEEANECAGAGEIVKLDNNLEVTHPYFPDDPTIDNPFDPDVWTPTEVEPPGYASPYY